MRAPINIPQRVALIRLAVCSSEGLPEMSLMSQRQGKASARHVLWHLLNDQLGFMGQEWVARNAGYSKGITSDIFASERLQERCARALRIYKQYLWDARMGRLPDLVSHEINWMEKARLAAGLSRQQLADKVGVTRWAVERWERDGKKPRAHRRAAIEEALGIAVSDANLYQV